MSVLKIEWERLMSDGETCPRCGSIEKELEKSVDILRNLLEPKGINIILEKRELNLEQFQKNPLQSNRIIIDGHLLEDIIHAETGKSPCCSVCGPQECRTVIVDNEITYKTIPAELIVKACLTILSH